MKKINCKFCGKETNNNMQGYCQACYKYFVMEKKQLHSCYNDGTIHYADNGNAICPICGKEFRKLGGHLRYSHGVAEDVYRAHGINPRKAHASNIEYRIHMKDVQHPKTITVNLIQHGKDTRIKPGEKFRINYKLRSI